MPLARRLPKRGFVNIFRKEVRPVNVQALEIFDNGQEVTLEELQNKGLIKSVKTKVKILGQGAITKKLTINAHAFSTQAKEKIQKAGGKVVVI